MRIFSKVLYFLAYSVILSFMPILVGLLFSSVFGYSFALLDASADLLITDFCLAATILRDTIENQRLTGKGIIFSMLLVCCFSAGFFGGIHALTGLGIELGREAVNRLAFLSVILTSVTVAAGIITQFLTSMNPSGAANTP